MKAERLEKMQNKLEETVDFTNAILNLEKEAFLNGFRIGQHYGNDARGIRNLHKSGFRIDKIARIYDLTTDEVASVLKMHI